MERNVPSYISNDEMVHNKQEYTDKEHYSWYSIGHHSHEELS